MKILEFPYNPSPDFLFSEIASEPASFFLDSSDQKGFSFFGYAPYRTSTSLEEIEDEIHVNNNMNIPDRIQGLPFIGGGIGFLSYEAVRLWEPHLKAAKKEPFYIPDIQFGFYDTFVAFDHGRMKAFIISHNLTPQSQNTFERLVDICQNKVPEEQKKAFVPETAKLLANTEHLVYSKMIQKAKHYIFEGEIYQVNLSQCLSTKLSLPPYEIYQRLRRLNPGNFSAYLNTVDCQILSSSPERFINVDESGKIRTEPIKGTIRRGRNDAEDAYLKQKLWHSEKDRAELMMIVDLERNDLGKICEYGSVNVSELCTLKTFSTVHHLASTVEGKLKTKKISDIIHATFPGGSITGAPKLRAMQIIDELEPHNRGIYTGSIGYIDYRGQIDLNIAIRTMTHHEGIYTIPVGGGIVSDSQIESEFNETLHKGKALISAVSKA